MKKIMYTINFLTNGGPTRVLENIVSNLDMAEYDVFILTIIDENDEILVNKYQEKGVKIISFGYSKNIKEVLKHKNKILNTIYDVDPDVIHTHGIVTTFLVASYKKNVKRITTIHNNIFEDYKLTYGTLKGLAYAFLHIAILRKFDEIICCSKTAKDALRKFLNKSIYIRNGIDIQFKSSKTRNEIRKELGIPDDSIVFVYGGVINKRKRVCELVEMINTCINNNEYWLVIGDGSLLDKAISLSNNCNIKFLGFKNNIIDYFRAADIYVSNSSSEGFSISVLEALECNLLLLLSDIPSHKECFEVDDTFYIGEYFNASNFRDKKNHVVKMLKNDIKTSEFKEKYFSSNIMAKEYIKYY